MARTNQATRIIGLAACCVVLLLVIRPSENAPEMAGLNYSNQKKEFVQDPDQHSAAAAPQKAQSAPQHKPLPVSPSCRADSSWLARIKSNERKIRSQGGQDGVLEYIFKHIGTTNRAFVEFGFNELDLDHGSGANSAHLYLDLGWRGMFMDLDNANETINLVKARLTPQNMDGLFRFFKVPEQADYVSIDVDSIDIWLFRRILSSEFAPRVFTTEYNPAYAPWEMFVEDEHWHRLQCHAYGTSAAALQAVAHEHGYVLVHMIEHLDMFWVRRDLLAGCELPGFFTVTRRVKDAFPQLVHKPCTVDQLTATIDYGVWAHSPNRALPGVIGSWLAGVGYNGQPLTTPFQTLPPLSDHRLLWLTTINTGLTPAAAKVGLEIVDGGGTARLAATLLGKRHLPPRGGFMRQQLNWFDTPWAGHSVTAPPLSSSATLLAKVRPMVPRAADFGFLRIDMAGPSLWTLRALLQDGFRPRVIAITYSRCAHQHWQSQLMYAFPDAAPSGSAPDKGKCVYGASWYALYTLACAEFLYKPLYINLRTATLYFVRGDLVQASAALPFMIWAQRVAATSAGGGMTWLTGQEALPPPPMVEYIPSRYAGVAE